MTILRIKKSENLKKLHMGFQNRVFSVRIRNLSPTPGTFKLADKKIADKRYTIRHLGTLLRVCPLYLPHSTAFEDTKRMNGYDKNQRTTSSLTHRTHPRTSRGHRSLVVVTTGLANEQINDSTKCLLPIIARSTLTHAF